MRSRVPSFIRALCLWLACAFAFAACSDAQIRMAGGRKPQQERSAAADGTIMTSLQLNLCVDGSAVYPCPVPLISDTDYISTIRLTYGQILDGVVAFSPANLNSGTITIYKDVEAVCSLRIGIDAACPPASTIFDVDDYTISATLTFPAGSSYADSSTNVSPCINVPTACNVSVSILKDSSAITLSSSQPIAPLGAPVTISATATGGYGATPNGQVVFSVDGAALAPTTLNAAGVASFTTSTLALGPHTITASYAGAQDFFPAADAPPFQQQIVPPATATTITSSLNPSIVGGNVTFTAIVATAADFIGAPTGAVIFKDGATAFGTVVVASKGGANVAQTSISTLAEGTHSITANYSGDRDTSPSVSPVLVQQVDYPLTVRPPGYTITVTPSPVSLIAGASVKMIVTVTPVGGFTGAVALSCSDLPNEAACTFDEATIPNGGGSTALSLSTMSPHDCGSSVPYGGFTGPAASAAMLATPRLFGYAGPVLAGALMLLLPRRRRRALRGLLSLAMVCLLAAMNGCSSHCTDFGTYPGGYTFRVNGMASSATPVTTSATSPGDGSAATPNVSTSVALTVKL